jgi:hypothetical protein
VETFPTFLDQQAFGALRRKRRADCLPRNFNDVVPVVYL